MDRGFSRDDAGVLRAVVELGTLGRLFTTSFGVSLLIKTVLFAAVLVIAYVNRSRLVPAVSSAVAPYARCARPRSR